jgi:carboxylesterase
VVPHLLSTYRSLIWGDVRNMSIVFSLDLKCLVASKPKAKRYGDDIYLKGDGERTIILIHGLTGTPNEVRGLASFFNRKGYTVLCPRLANHGASLDVLKFSRWQDFYASVREAFLSMPKEDREKEVFVSGLSMGALLGLLLADEFSANIKAVSCLAPTLFYDGWNNPGLKFLLPAVYQTSLKYMFYFKEEPPYGVKNKAVQERICRYYNSASLYDVSGIAEHGYPYFPAALLHQLHLLTKYLSKKLPEMKFPVQLIHAKDDDMASVKNSKFIYDRIKSDMKEMIILYDSYHMITADQERDVVIEKMEIFFNRMLTGAKK